MSHIFVRAIIIGASFLIVNFVHCTIKLTIRIQIQCMIIDWAMGIAFALLRPKLRSDIDL